MILTLTETEQTKFQTLIELQTKLQGVTVSSVIAGGAVRDFYLNKKVKDIDIFYWGNFKKEQCTSFIECLISTNLDYGDNQTCTHKGYYKGFDVDFIKVSDDIKDLDQLLKTFPASISQISLIPYSLNELLCTDAFANSVITKEIIFSASCPLKYYIKIQNKYQDYTYKNVSISPTSNSISWFPEPATSVKVSLKKKIKYKVINTNKECYREI